MADASNPAAAPVSTASGAAPVDGAPSASSPPARPLPTPEELLATFETLAAEHRVESQRISNLTAQLKGTENVDWSSWPVCWISITQSVAHTP